MPIGSVMLHDAVQELKRRVAGATPCQCESQRVARKEVAPLAGGAARRRSEQVPFCDLGIAVHGSGVPRAAEELPKNIRVANV